MRCLASRGALRQTAQCRRGAVLHGARPQDRCSSESPLPRLESGKSSSEERTAAFLRM
jgi:hypothetical protein